MYFLSSSHDVWYESVGPETDDLSAPPLLLLHGALGSSAQLRPLGERFTERRRIYLDFPGHGQSRLSSHEITTKKLMLIVADLIDHLKLGPVDVLGYSLGGYVGLELAADSRERVHSVVSHAMKFYWTDETVRRAIEDIEEEKLRATSERAHKSLSNMHQLPGLSNTIRSSQHLIQTFTSEQLSADTIVSAGVPILFSVGDGDELVPVEEVVQLYTAVGKRHAALAVQPATRHQMHTVNTALMEQLIRHFWNAKVTKEAA